LETIKLNIDGREIETQKGKSVLEASLDAGVYIPHLCHHPDLSPIGVCRLCIVEVEGMEGLPTSCTTSALDGMIVKTKTDKIDPMRRLAMELMLAGHPPDCGTCIKYLNCELQSLKQYLVSEQGSLKRRSKLFPINTGNPLFVQDAKKCIVCGRCVRACHELRGVGVLFYKKKEKETYIGTASDLPLADSGCRFCGACAEVCPTGAIMDKEELTKGKSRKVAFVPCRYTCPAEIDVPRYIRFIREKDYSAATAVIREKVPFPKVLGYVCDHPCETVCRRGEVNQSISIRELKRFAAEQDEKRLWEKNSNRKPSTDKKVAIIGSGPAGLTAAYYLSNQGHAVTVFESLPLAGGMMRFGIPEYRLPRNVLESEIRDLKNMGVEMKTNTHIESIDKLFDQGYDAVLVAVGAHKGQKLSIPGADHKGVLISTDFLRDVNTGKKVNIGKKVVVLGGGNVAFDCARIARRLGAEQVHIACLECRTDMPAACDEIDQGEAEGILVHPSKTSTRILSENGKITGVEFLDVESFTFDEDKNPQIEVVENSQHVLEADTVIFAIGQRPEIPEGFGLDTAANHLIELDSYTFNTSREGVFAAGDAVTGTASVIKAIASGRQGAIALDRFLEGSGDIDEKLAPPSDLEKCLGSWEGFASMNRCEESCILPEERLQSFCKVVHDMDEEAADYESNRCLQCDLRLKMTPVKFWGNY
jgi:NADPH-dependent glutamate synthase beta subunit-like oxidoreductase/Pyruvate/2-oxoacid:ferredoxin oxidoreductase delta subunit/ferredoxin